MKMKSELFKRVAFAVVGIPVAMFLIVYGALPFLFAVIIISSISLLEFYKLAKLKKTSPNVYLGVTFNVIITLYIYFALKNTEALMCSGLIIIGFILLFMLSSFIVELWLKKENHLLNVSTTISGILYACFPFYSLILIRELHKIKEFFTNNNINLPLFFNNTQKFENFSIYFVITIFLTIWIRDSAAYFLGKKFGKNKLYEAVSPKKTWEGAIAGFVFALISSVLLFHFLIPYFPFIHSIVVGIIIGIFGQIGDLIESLIKRDAGVKDSSNLIPGHGGALDRLDSALFVFPFIYIYIILIMAL